MAGMHGYPAVTTTPLSGFPEGAIGVGCLNLQAQASPRITAMPTTGTACTRAGTTDTSSPSTPSPAAALAPSPSPVGYTPAARVSPDIPTGGLGSAQTPAGREQMDDPIGRIAGRFARAESRRWARGFVLGLLPGLRRRNCLTIAELAGDLSPDGVQLLLAAARRARSRYDRPPHRQMTASAASRSGRYGAG